MTKIISYIFMWLFLGIASAFSVALSPFYAGIFDGSEESCSLLLLIIIISGPFFLFSCSLAYFLEKVLAVGLVKRSLIRVLNFIKSLHKGF